MAPLPRAFEALAIPARGAAVEPRVSRRSAPCRFAHASGARLRGFPRLAQPARTLRKKRRTSSASSSGCSMAAKWPPRGISLQWVT